MSKNTTGRNSEKEAAPETAAILQDDALEAVTGGAKKISGSVGKGGKNSSTLDPRGPGGFRTTD